MARLVAIYLLITWSFSAHGITSICDVSGCSCNRTDAFCSQADFRKYDPVYMPEGIAILDGSTAKNNMEAIDVANHCSGIQICKECGLQSLCHDKTVMTQVPDPNNNCYETGDTRGTRYRGKVRVTKNGRDCQFWKSQYPNKHTKNTTDQFHGEDVEKAENFCRNFGNHGLRTLCYTMDPSTRWEFCADVPSCSEMGAVLVREAADREEQCLVTVHGQLKYFQDDVSVAECPGRLMVTKCDCLARDNKSFCDGTSVTDDAKFCRAHVGGKKSRILARACCGSLKGDMHVVTQPKPRYDRDYMKRRGMASPSAKCPTGYTLLTCLVHSYWSYGQMTVSNRENECFVPHPCYRCAVQAICFRGVESCLDWVSGDPSVNEDDPKSVVSCPERHVVTRCHCMTSDDKDCKGVTIVEDAKTCIAHGTRDGGPVKANACCGILEGTVSVKDRFSGIVGGCPEKSQLLSCQLYAINLRSVMLNDSVGLLPFSDGGRLLQANKLRKLRVEDRRLLSVPESLIGRFTNLTDLSLVGKSFHVTPKQLIALESTFNGTVIVSTDYLMNDDDSQPECSSGNCFATCGEPPYLNREHVRDVGKSYPKYSMYSDLSVLMKNSTGPTFVWSQFVTSSGPVSIEEQSIDAKADTRLIIITREFSMNRSESQYFRFKNIQYSRNTEHRPPCSLTVLNSTENGHMLYKLQQGNVVVIAQKIRYGEECSLTPHPLDFSLDEFADEMTLQYFKAVTYCAKLKSELGSAGERSEAIGMIDWVLTVMSWMDLKEVGKELHTDAMVTRSDIKIVQNVARFVPVLSSIAYGNILDSQVNVAKTYLDEFERFEDIHSDERFERGLMMAMQQQSIYLADAAGVEMDQARDALEIVKISVNKLKREFHATQPKLREASRVFEEYTGAYIAYQASQALLNIFGAIITFDLSNTLKSLNHIQQLLSLITLISTMVKTMLRITSATNKMMTVEVSGDDARSYLKNFDKAAQLSVQVVEWRNMAKSMAILLGQGDVATIHGSAGYQIKVQEMTNWGEAYTVETIRQTNLMRRFISKQAAHKARSDYSQYMNSLLRNTTQRSTIDPALDPLMIQTLNIKWGLTDTLISYCQTYFYYHFKLCRHDISPKMSDSLRELIRKMNKAKIQYARNLASTSLSQPITNVVVDIEDTTGGNCPLTTFKETKSLTYHVGLDEPEFLSFDRVRITEIFIDVVGLRTNGSSVYISIRNAGTFQDRYYDDVYNFTSAPLFRALVYKPSSDDIMMSAKVHQGIADLFLETSPFTTWIFEIIDPKELVDLSEVSSVRIEFEGSAVPNQGRDKRFSKRVKSSTSRTLK